MVALLAGGMGWMTATWAADVAKDRPQTLAELSNARLRLAHAGFEMSLASYGKLDGSVNARQVAEWSKRVVAVVRAENDQEKLRKSLEEHRDQMQKLFETAIRKQNAGFGSKLDSLEAEYPLLEAESWLLEANAGN
jgi:hypothetical protein